MGDDVFILAGLFLLVSLPFCLSLLLRWRFPNVRYKLVCHILSGALLLYLGVVYLMALRAYRVAGNQDDGSSSMAAFLLISAVVVVAPENLLLYLPPLRIKRTLTKP